MKKIPQNLTASTIAGMFKKGNIHFKNEVQRGDVWDLEQRSELIASIIEDFPIPPIYAIREQEPDDKGKPQNKYNIFDGRQRTTTIYMYLNDLFTMSDYTPTLEHEDETGNITEHEVAGLKFSELDKELQHIIEVSTITMYWFENLTPEEKSKLFFKLNNGKPLTNIELTRSKVKSISQVQELAKHEIIGKAISDKQKSKFNDELLIMQSWACCNIDNLSFSAKPFMRIMEQSEITLEQVDRMNKCFGVINSIYDDLMKLSETQDKTKNKKLAKKFITRTHFVSCCYAINEKMEVLTTERIKERLISFFNTENTSIDKDYNEAAREKTASTQSIETRKETILKHLTQSKEEIV